MIIILVKIHSWPTAIWHCSSSTEMKCFFHDTRTNYKDDIYKHMVVFHSIGNTKG